MCGNETKSFQIRTSLIITLPVIQGNRATLKRID